MMLRTALLALCLPLAMGHARGPALQRNPVFTGKVIGVLAGDTMRVLVSDNGLTRPATEVGLRLWGVDAPKPGEPFGREAKERLAKLAMGGKVIVEHWGRDEHGNSIGEVYLELPSKWDKRSYFSEILGKSGPTQQIVLNDEMVAGGLARRRKPSGNRDYDFIEVRLQRALEAAQKAKRGIWKN